MADKADSRPDPDLEMEIVRIQERLREIRDELRRARQPSNNSTDDLLEEERLLVVRLQEISDQVAAQTTGLAERLVRQEGADPKEFPDLPSEPGDPE